MDAIEILGDGRDFGLQLVVLSFQDDDPVPVAREVIHRPDREDHGSDDGADGAAEGHDEERARETEERPEEVREELGPSRFKRSQC